MLTSYAQASAPARLSGEFTWLAPKQLARLAGVIYLVLAVCGGFAQLYVRAGLKVPGDAAATADTIRASASLVRLGFVADLVNIACFVGLAFALYVLLAPVNRRIAATFVICVAIAAAIMGVNMLNHLGALVVATDPTYASTLGTATADALALLFLELHGHGYLIAQIFFGAWLLPLGHLVFTSGFFPRVLGILLMLACFAYLGDIVATYSSPDFESGLTPFFGLVAGVGEISFLVWLLVMGAKEPVR
jgi:hypothetical protein